MADADDATPGVPADALAHGMVPSPGGQNVGVNYRSPTWWTITQSMNVVHGSGFGWMYSYGHCKNILRPSFTKMGAAGVQSAEGVWYWTQNFQ
jgi:uncharacterized protein YkwD